MKRPRFLTNHDRLSVERARNVKPLTTREEAALRAIVDCDYFIRSTHYARQDFRAHSARLEIHGGAGDAVRTLKAIGDAGVSPWRMFA